jgi:succinate-semialdehyde dehydrogenase / glutarate-semialdehyde dehydrogenase
MRRQLRSINPATGEVIRTFDAHTEVEIESRLQRASEAFGNYRRLPFAERSRLINGVAEILEKDRKDLGAMITLEMGKPLRAAIQEVEKCALGCRFYAQNAERFLADEQIDTPPARSFVRHQPIGAILAIMPWNFPFWQLFRFAAPALMAGNVALLKHASNVPQCAIALEDIFRRAGFPEGAFQTLLVGSDSVAAIIKDHRIAAVTLTGSVGAGAHVASVAGKAIKKTVLELGGSDPFIVMTSANLDQAVATAVRARTINNGQSCIAAKRFIVDRKIAGAFEQKFVEGMAALKVGDPRDEATDVGPLATAEIRDGLEEQVNKSLQMGARALLGGKRLDRPGFFFAPTILTNIPKNSPADQDELFGPVASVFVVNGIEAAVELANNTHFGLGSSIWTNDESERDSFINEIEAGAAFVNGMVASDPRLPFGGIKQSGYGRELSRDGIREFVNIKTVSIYPSPA